MSTDAELTGENPLVTVIIPVYNRRDYVTTALNSCTNQSYTFLEILVIDDGSSDGSVDIIRELAASDPRIRLLENEVNRGANYCRNEGLRQAKGSLINFLDSDDAFLPDKISRQVEAFRSDPLLEVVVCACERRDLSSGEVEKMDRIVPVGDVADAFVTKKIVWKTIAPLWKKSFLSRTNGFNELLRNSQDYEYFSRLTLLQPKVAYLREVLCVAYELDSGTDRFKIRSKRNIPRTYKNNIASRYLVRREAKRLNVNQPLQDAIDRYVTRYLAGTLRGAFRYSFFLGLSLAFQTLLLRLNLISVKDFLK